MWRIRPNLPSLFCNFLTSSQNIIWPCIIMMQYDVLSVDHRRPFYWITLCKLLTILGFFLSFWSHEVLIFRCTTVVVVLLFRVPFCIWCLYGQPTIYFQLSSNPKRVRLCTGQEDVCIWRPGCPNFSELIHMAPSLTSEYGPK